MRKTLRLYLFFVRTPVSACAQGETSLPRSAMLIGHGKSQPRLPASHAPQIAKHHRVIAGKTTRIRAAIRRQAGNSRIDRLESFFARHACSYLHLPPKSFELLTYSHLYIQWRQWLQCCYRYSLVIGRRIPSSVVDGLYIETHNQDCSKA